MLLSRIRNAFSAIIILLMFLLGSPVIALMVVLSFGYLRDQTVRVVSIVIGRTALFLLGVNLKVVKHGDPYSRPSLVLINHNSVLDMFVILALGVPNIRYVAKYEFQFNPVFFLIGHITGQIFIKRDNSEKAIAVLKRAVARIQKQNLSILVAPEGSRKHEGIVGPFKKGAFRMAVDLNYPLLPVFIDGARELAVGGSLNVKRGTVTATLYPFIETNGWTRDKVPEYADTVRGKYMEWSGVTEETNLLK